jgi:hypothetical protein
MTEKAARGGQRRPVAPGREASVAGWTVEKVADAELVGGEESEEASARGGGGARGAE